MLVSARQIFLGASKRAAWTNPYITDGLVAMWDGEWNAGGGEHDSSATTWVDLVGGRVLTLNGTAAFGDDYMETTDYESGAISSFSLSNILQVECCVDIGRAPPAGWYSLFDDIGGNWIWAEGKFIQSLNYDMGVGNVYSMNDMFAIGKTTPFTLSLDDGNHIAIVDGSTVISPSAEWVEGGVGFFAIFGNIDNVGEPVCAKGKCFCVRLYNRSLSAAEVAANYTIDKARFNLT